MNRTQSHPTLTLEVDPGSGTIVHADPALEAALGFAVGTLVGRHVSILGRPHPSQSESATDPSAEMFSDAAHDLVAPLNQVAVFVSLLIRKNQPWLSEPDVKEVFNHIQTAVRRMRILTEGLKRLSIALSEPLDVGPVDTAALLDVACEKCKRKFEGVAFELSAGALPVITGASKRIAFVFEELIENAIKFRASTPVEIQVCASERNGRWIFSFRDNARGFESGFAHEIFRIFRRLDAGSVPGCGVGLAISRQIIAQHRGEIWAESQPGAGTTVFFSLPIDPA